MKFTIPYPINKKEQTRWNKDYGMNAIEEWKKVAGFENYSVSNLGRIKNQYGKILSGGKDKNGYKRMVFCNNGLRKSLRICRVVATAFIENASNLPIVNHKNEIKDDDRACNLEWCTHKHNSNWGTNSERTKRTFESTGTSKPIKSINPKTGEEKTYKCISDVSKDGFSFDGVRKCLHKRNRTSGGLAWEFLGEEYNGADRKGRI